VARILFLLTQDLDSPSGLGRYGPMARELSRLGHRVDIAALHPDYEKLISKKVEQDGVTVHYVAPMHVIKMGNQKTYYPRGKLALVVLRATIALTRVALSEPCDLIYVGKPHPMNTIAGMVGKIINKRKLFLDCDDDEVASGNFGSAWQKNMIAFFQSHAPRWVDRVTTNTYHMRDKIIRFGVQPEKIFYLPNGVERDRFEPLSEITIMEAKKRLGLLNKRVIAYIGSMSLANHAVDLLIDAFENISKQMSDVVLLLVGGGEDFDKIQNMVKEKGLFSRVCFTGRVPPDQVALYYHLADVSVDPVRDDDAARGRSPLKMFESWAAGVPFVTADVGDRKILVGETKAAEIVSTCSVQDFSDVLQHLLKDTARLEKLGISGYKRVEAFYWDRILNDANEVILL
jgi:glycosyltransferase involved in cell wall biosynthesis